MDPELVDKIVHEVKSQGVFDEFRKDSIADVDTKPAYQNLRQRVDNAVNKFLSSTRWTPEMNKNQLREKLRRHIAESGFLDAGVERIVDQVVNPKIGSSFQPRIEEIAYTFLGLPLPVKKAEYSAQHTLMPPLPALPPLPGSALTIQTSNLLPTDLEQVSPDSDASNAKSDAIDDDEESPPFEPLIAHNKVEEEILTEQNMDLSNTPSPSPPPLPLPPLPPPQMEDKLEKAAPPLPPLPPPQNDPPPPGVDELPPPPPLPPMPKSPPQLPPAPAPEKPTIKTSEKSMEEKENGGSEEAETTIIECTKLTCEKKTFDIMAAMSSQDSQLSQVSSDSHLTVNDFNEVKIPHSPSEATTANISEEAQMPKFNENSLETNTDVAVDPNSKEFHFDIKKDEIKFEGTERKTSFAFNKKEGDFSEINKQPPEPQMQSSISNNKKSNDKDLHNVSIGSNTSSELSVEPSKVEQERESTPTQTTAESNFYSSINDSCSAQLCIVDDNEGSMTNDDSATQSNSIVLLPQATSSPSPPLTTKKTAIKSSNDLTTTTLTTSKEELSNPLTTYKNKKDIVKSKKHRKYDKDKERHHESTSDKHNNKSGSKEHRRREKNNEKSHKNYHGKRHSSEKSDHLSRSSRNKTERSEITDKRNAEDKKNGQEKRKQLDDHNVSKERVFRPKSPDSNDDDDGGGKTSSSQNSRIYDSVEAGKSTSKTTSDTKPVSTNNNIDDDETTNNEKDVRIESPETNVTSEPVINNKESIEIIELNAGKEMNELHVGIDKSVSEDDKNCSELEYFMDDEYENLLGRLKLLEDLILLCQSSYIHCEVGEFEDQEYVDASNNTEVIQNEQETGLKNIINTRKRHHTELLESDEKDMKDINCSIIITRPTKNKNHSKINDEDDDANNNCKSKKNRNNAYSSQEDDQGHPLVMDETAVFSTLAKLKFNSKENNVLTNTAEYNVTSFEEKTSCRKTNSQKSIEKQRYKSDDLYKPRSSTRSSRRNLSTITS